jgi:PIN domain nuclease of toxin-antitoxin system
MAQGLLDTHSFIWHAEDNPKISDNARDFLIDSQNQIFLSLASLWEMAVKANRGKLEIPEPFNRFLPYHLKRLRVQILPIKVAHSLYHSTLPFPHSDHKDPFDRLLISQSLVEGLPLISIDEKFDAYGVQRIW